MDLFEQNKPKMRLFITMSVFALGISGIYSILIVLLRSPGIQNLLPYKHLFSSSLVSHVNMSVLIFMISMAKLFMHNLIGRYISTFLFILSILGMILIGLSPFKSHTAILNNYIPVIENSIFFSGLTLFLIAFFLTSLISINNFIFNSNKLNIEVIIPGCISFTSLCSFLSLFMTRNVLDYNSLQNLGSHEFYEQLFWGFGHLLQFVYFATYIAAITKIFAIETNDSNNPNFFKIILIINALLPIIVLESHFSQNDHMSYYTDHMRIYGGIPFALYFIYLITNYKKIIKFSQLSKTIIFFSTLLFGFGGIIALLISGVNVTIPAHYHGSTVGITLGFMGFMYILFNRYFAITYSKTMKYQLVTYAIGQLLHISGLALSGGYGALRKNPDIITSTKIKISMGIMGIGGLIAIISGLTFITIMLKYIHKINKMARKL